MDNKEIKKLGENFAADYLLANGYRIIERNFTCKAGEIDIIAYKDGAVSIVEVKTKQNYNFERTCLAINGKKQKKLHRTAEYYMSFVLKRTLDIKIDVIEININHTENAVC